ncbi:class I SAM-dependent methyltransferase [Solidesulfovibrio sp.]|uniref:class I SAM-dependent methyltransferase n=1 Tax=Solidesulfovibrio sp. TaxID=2910990 RepID=UPI002B218493|nr:methyltransferase domain-containing protein [Solidesulfovibrio sp.]MEA5088412.1 methyltransferase domain-containing protein [Solidesulfovibrio sp.]
MSWDPAWERVFRENDWGKYPGEDLIRFVARNFYRAQRRSEVKILEIGCGPGANLWYVAREGFQAFGVDGSPMALAQARRRLDAECPGWTGLVARGDMTSLPWRDGIFDAVIDNEAGCCNGYEASRTIYAEAARVLKPGGRIFVRTFAEGTWGEGTGRRLGPDAWQPTEGPMANTGCTRFTRREHLSDLLSPFVLEEVERISRTLDAGRRAVVEWIAIGRLPGDAPA